MLEPKTVRLSAFVRARPLLGWANGWYLAPLLALTSACDSISQDDSHAGRMGLALFVLAVLAVRFVYGRLAATPTGAAQQRVFARLYAAVLTAACLWGIGNYYQFDLDKVTKLHSYQDTTYYYVNSKYFDELSYFSLYPAMLMADEEREHGSPLLDEVTRFRDLHTYQLRSRRLDSEERRAIRSRFSDARWAAFKHDVDYLVGQWPGGARYFFSDHGYNPPPTWTIVGGTLSELVPVEHVWVLAKIDLVLVIVMFIVVARTYGPETLAYSVLFFVTTYSGRWPMLGDSILRFDWVVALVLGTCWLRTGRPMAAGMALAYAALNRIFPAIFFFPVLLGLGFHALREHDYRSTRRFVAGAAVATVVLVGAALLTYGPSAFSASADNLLLHQSSASFSRYRVGLGTALGFRSEHHGAALAAAGGIEAKAALIDRFSIAMKLLAVGLCVVIAWWARRSRWSPDRLLPLAIAPLFVLTNPQINYFNLRLVLVGWHLLDLDRARNRFGLLALFAIEAMTQFSHVSGNDRYATMAYTSVGLCVYFIAVYAGLFVEARAPQVGRRHAGSLAAMGLAVLALVYALYWRTGRQVEPRRVDASDLAEVHTSGTRWDTRGTVRILPEQTLHIEFETPQRGTAVDISFDNNDTYELYFDAGDEEVGRMQVRRDSKAAANGLWREQFPLPPTVSNAVFDRIRIMGRDGDGAYSVGHVVILSK